MKIKTKAKILTGVMAVSTLAPLPLTLAGCPDGDTEQTKPQEDHTGTISAFGKTINVKGDAAISATDFTNAKGKLEAAMIALDTATAPENMKSLRDRYDIMLNRAGFKIIIGTGNAGPDADANKSMTVGAGYLLVSDVEQTIPAGIMQKVAVDNAFAAVINRGAVRVASVGASRQHLKPLSNPKKIHRENNRAERAWLATVNAKNVITRDAIQAQNGLMV